MAYDLEVVDPEERPPCRPIFNRLLVRPPLGRRSVRSAHWLALLLALPLATHADQNWDGDNPIGNFGFNDNWYGNVQPAWGYGGALHFSYRNNGAQTSLYNDYGIWVATDGIYWDTTFPVGLDINGAGNGLDFNDKIQNDSAFAQVLNIPVSGAKNGSTRIEINPVNGDLTLSQPVYNDNNRPFEVWGDNLKLLTVNNTLSGNSSVSMTIKQYSKVLFNTAQTFGGSSTFYVDEGELWLGSGGSLQSGLTVNMGLANADTAKFYLSASAGGSTDSHSITVNNSGGTKVLGGLNASGTHTFSGAITLNGPVSLEANQSGGSVTFSGAMSAGSTQTATAIGPGTVTLSGTGDNVNLAASVTGGTLILAKTSSGSVHAVGSGLTVAGGLAQLGGSGGDQIFNNTAITINSGRLDLNGNSETVDGFSGSGGALTNSTGSATLIVGTNNASGTYSGSIVSGAGSVALTKLGSGTLTLPNANTYTGGTSITNGVALIGHQQALGTGTITLNGGYLRSSTALTGANAVANSVTLSLDSGLGGSSDLQLSGTVTHSPSSALTIGSGATTTLSGPVQLTTSGTPRTLTLTLNGNLVISGNIGQSTGAGSISSVTSAGTLTLAGTNTYSGTTTLRFAVNINSTTAFGSGAGTVDFRGITIDNTSGGPITLANNNPITLNGSPNTFTGTHDLNLGTGTMTMQNANRTWTVNGGVLTVGGGMAADNAGNRLLTKNGTGTLVLNAAAGTWTGGTALNNGILAIGNNTALGTGTLAINGGTIQGSGAARTITIPVTVGASGGFVGGSVDFTIGPGGTLAGTGGSRILTVTNTATTFISGTFAPSDTDTSGRTFTFNGSGNVFVSGVVSNNLAGTTANASHVRYSGTGTLTLTNAANVYIGKTTVESGTLEIATLANLSASSSLGAPTSSGNGAVSLGLTTTSVTLRYVGTGNSASNRRIDLDGTTGGATLEVANSGHLLLTGTMNIPNAGAKTLTLTGSSTGIGSNNIAIPDSTGSGAVNLVKNGSGTWSLGGASSFTGGTTLNAGQLNIHNANALGNVAGTLTIAGGSLGNTSGGSITTVNHPQNWNADFAFAGSSPLNLGAGAVTLNAARQVTVSASTLTVGGIIGDGGSGYALTKAGAGTLVLAGANTYGGDTTLSAGTLRLGASGVIPDGAGKGNVSVGGSGTLDVAGFIETVNGLSGGGMIDNSAGTGTLTIGANAQTSAYEGLIQNSGGTLALVKTGIGTLTLSGTNTYAGGTTMGTSAGQLNINNSSALGTGALAITGSGDALDNTSGGPITIANAWDLSGGNPTYVGSNPLTINGPTTLSGTDRTITVTASTLALSGAIGESGSRALTKNGNGTLTLSGTNTYSGNTTISAGSVNINSTTAFGTGATVALNGVTVDNTSGAALALANNHAVSLGGNNTFTGTHDLTFGTGAVTLTSSRTWGVLAGILTFNGGVTDTGVARSLTKSGVGTLILNAAAGTWTGGVILNNGILAIGSDTALGTGSLSINGGTIQSSGGSRAIANTAAITGPSNGTVGGADDFTFNGTFTGVGGSRILTVSNSGLTTFANTFYLTDTESARTLTIAGTGDVTIGSTIANNSSGNTTAANLSKTSTGTLTIGAAATYTGNTRVSAGTLRVNGSIATSAHTLIHTAGILGGNGSVGVLEIENGGTLAPGSSVGTLVAGNTTWDTNGVYVFEINDFAGTYGTSPGWDKLDIAGNLNISATIARPFTIQLTSLNGSSPGSAANFSGGDTAYTQHIASVSGTISGFAANLFTLDTSAFSNPTTGSWSIQQGAGTIDLVYGPAAPAAPTGLTASDGVFSDKVALAWLQPANTTGYLIYRNTVNSPPASAIATNPGGTSVTYDDTSAQHGVTYYYWVRALNGGGASGYSTPDTGFLRDTTIIKFQ